MASVEARVALCCSAEELFDFLTRPENLPGLMPEETPLEVLEAPEVLEHGSRLVVRLGGIGPPQRLEYEVTEWVRPLGFVERMTRGPLASWEHRRTISNAGKMVELVEQITFGPPEGLAGLLLSESRITESLETGLTHRHRRLRELLEDTG